MVNQSNKTLNTNITKLVNQTYQYGFSTTIEKDIIKKGLNEQTIRLISEKKKEKLAQKGGTILLKGLRDRGQR